MQRAFLTMLVLAFAGTAFAAPSCPSGSFLNPTGVLGGEVLSNVNGYWKGCLQNTNSVNSLVFNPDPGPWGNAYVAWEVTQTGNVFTYSYEVEVASKNISHAIFGLSNSTIDDSGNIVPALTICANNTPGVNCIWGLSSGYGATVDTFNAQDQGNSNPGIPGDLYGVKFDKSGVLVYQVSYSSYRVPVWQNFYAKDGKDGGEEVYMYNSGFDGGNHFIIGADTRTLPDDPPPVPEPGFYGVLAGGLAGLYFYVRRRQTA